MTHEKFKELFDQNFDAVRNYLYYRSGDAELSTDLAQETFLRLWHKQLGAGHANIRALLYKIAWNLFISHYRREVIMSRLKLRHKPETMTGSPDEPLVFEEMKSAYERALGEMPDRQRTVFLMSRIDRLTYREIADRLGLSVKAVEKRMSLALSFIKQKIDL